MWYCLRGLSNFVRLRFRDFGALLLLAVLFAAATDALASNGGDPARADMVVIYKHERMLHLLRAGERIRSYRIALGGAPKGHKVQEGDSRTPEGAYIIDWRNPDSRFHLSLRISYPGRRDLLRSAWLGVAPGGQIMIHGLPNGRDADAVGHPAKDWTDGCIAVTNREIEEIWELVADETPVFIFP